MFCFTSLFIFFSFLCPTHSDLRALSVSFFRAQVRKKFAAHGASVGQTKIATLATATAVARAGGPGGGGPGAAAAAAAAGTALLGLGPDGDLAAVVALPALAATLTQQQRAVSSRRAGPAAARQR